MKYIRSMVGNVGTNTCRPMLFTMLFLFPVLGTAATLYVEKWGESINQFTGCKKQAPCITIQHALNTANPNDKIIVGPGTYLENIVINTLGVKLYSTAGRHGTIIDGSGTGEHTAQILQPRIQFGKKGKGFTLIGATGFFQAGLYVEVTGSSPRIRVEGNRFGKNQPQSDIVAYSNYIGMDVGEGGEKIQIRHNIFQNNERHGLVCSSCYQSIVRENRSERNGEWGIIHSGSRSTIEKNLFAANLTYGIQTGLGARSSKIKSNIAEDNALANFRFIRGNDLNVSRNLAVGAITGDGMRLDNTTETGPPARISNNLLLENFSDGLLVNGSDGVNLERNLSQGNGADAYSIENTASVGRNRFNAAIDNVGCGISEDSLIEQEEVFRFFGLNNGLEFCPPGSFVHTGAPAVTPVNPGVSAAAKVVGG